MITNEQRDNLLLQYYDRGILKKEIRSYEVSLWTLQDEFITVLKWSDVEQQGRIEDAKMTLNIDGTQQLSFSIPMYYWMNGELKENPNWYNTQNGNLIKGLRKLKVIFNKGDYPIEEASKHVFEFVIIDIAESHDTDILTCEIKAEGLAFQELGKIGYKLNLSQANFELDYQDWEETGHWTKKDGTISTQQPIQSVNYWCEECCDLLPIPDNGPVSSHIWYYDIQMNWKSFEGTENRSSKKVYEETYTTSWADNLTPNGIQNYQEKARAVEIDNSNLYNITQTIAEKFGIFCRYEYLYDVNYHIIGKKIVFYNNFMNEDPTQTISLQYPYSSSKITRTQASAEVTTKLFVLDVENDATAGGLNSITFSPSNYSHEDYILNFDYMYETGAINKEQYEYIATYNQQMRTINSVLENLQLQRDTYEFQKPEIEAKQTIARNSIALDQEQELQNSALRNELDSKDGQEDGFITITNVNADYLLISKGENDTYYINLARTNKGIVEDSVKIYRHLSNGTLSGEITNFSFNYDQYGNLSSISLKAISEITENDKVLTRAFLTYKYDPCLYYDKVVKIWQTKLAKDQQDLDNYTAELAVINQKLDSIYEQIEAKITEKEKAVKAFERMMGPAIREGYWQPENYNDYGDRYIINKSISNNDITADSGNDAIVAWDSEVFDTEETLYYEIGINQDLEYYPCIDLSAVFSNGIPSNLDEYSVVWKATNINGYSYDWDSIKDLTIFHVNSQALIRFIKYNNTVKPVLMLVGAKNLSAEQITRMKSAGAGARLEIYSTTVENGTISVSHGSTQYSIGNNWIQVAAGTSKTTTPIIYPRIKFSSLLLKTETSNLYIKYNNQLLELGKDYYIRTRNTLRTSDQNYYPEYYITIKPETIIKYGVGHEVNVDYILSNANTSIYLDALQVSKENAYPKAAYELDTSILNVDLTNRLYDTLAQIVMINDAQLKLHNAFGYISQVELDLDHYENDKIEIKNYKTKFEDLFSTIIAQTEAMKQMGTGIGAAVNGSIPLSAAATESTLAQQTNIFQAYLDSYFDSSEVVKQRLKELFNEAGKILGDANKSLKSVQALTVENAAILSGFAQNIQEELTAKVTKSKEKPASFKVGDIWIQEDDEGNEIGRYVATFNSADLTKDDTESGTGGFVQTFDGTLASITGTNMDIDTNNGKIDIYGTHEINLRSGEHVYIGAGDTIDIVGNNAVNIGGGSINIAADSTGTHKGGIHIVSSGINFQQSDTAIDTAIEGAIASTNANISKVLIDPGKIELGSSDILMRGANKIQMVTSRGTSNNTSAIEISPDTGVWIGSGRGIRLFSGGFSYNATTNELTKISASGASVELNNEHLILGFMNTSSTGNAIELDQDKIIIASGSATIGNQNVTGTSNSLIGAKFTKDSIGMAVQAVNGSTTTTTAFLMDVHGFTVGSDGINVAADTLRDTARGSYIRINGEGIELGSLADLYINTDNFKLQTHSRDKNNTNFTEGETIMALGNKLQSIDYYTQIVDGVLKDRNGNALPTTGDNAPNVRLLVNKNGLYAKGSVYADSFVAVGPNGYLKATASNFGFYDSNNSPIFTINNNAEIEANKKLSISAENLYIGNQNYSTIATNINNNNTIESLKMYRVWSSSNQLIVNNVNIITGSGTSTADSNWQEKVPTPTSNNPFIWSVMRYKKGDNNYYYSTPQYEETLTNNQATTYYKFKRTNSTTAPSIQNLTDLNTNWFLEVPIPIISGNSSTNAQVTLPYVWRTLVTAKVGQDPEYSIPPERVEDYEGISDAAVKAINIANGYTSVPYVDATGIKIQNGNITISAQAGIKLESNSSLSFTTSSGNNALIFDNDGITLASAKSIALAANGTLDIVTSNVTIRSNAENGQNYFYVGDSGDSPTSYIKYGKDAQGNNVFKVKGEIEATNALIDEQVITDIVSANLASIGGWTIDSTKIYSRYNDLDTNYVALDSGTTNENYAIWAGDDQSSDAPFRVKRNGAVYLNSLMVLDKKNANNNWGLGGTDNDHEGIYTVTEGTDDEKGTYGYKAIDFSKLNFNQAVSIIPSCSGSVVNIKVNLWGVLNKSANLAVAFTPLTCEITGTTQEGANTGNLAYQIEIGNDVIEDSTEIVLSASTNDYNQGWNDCIDTMKASYGKVVIEATGTNSSAVYSGSGPNSIQPSGSSQTITVLESPVLWADAQTAYKGNIITLYRLPDYKGDG